MTRFELIRQHINIAKGRGLEIGPLVSPIVTGSLGEIYYTDRATTAELREWYENVPGIDVNAIVPVDFVWGERRLAAAAESKAPFDYVVASHVFEHVPDLIGCLQEVSSVLAPGGRLSLCLPDCRFTFDVRRRESDISELIEAYVLGLRRPAVRATFDHFYRHVDPVDPAARWRGDCGHTDPPFDLAKAIEIARSATGRYIDTHCWVFSDATFAHLVRNIAQVGLIDLRVVSFTPTRPNEIEFFVTLERPANEGCTAEERMRRNADSVPNLHYTNNDKEETLRLRIRMLEQTLALMTNSTSWRLTAPIRKLRSLLLGLKDSAGWG